jgi:hypothetical protein
MAPARIALVIVISWAILFFLSPYIAALPLLPAASAFFFYNAIISMRTGVTGWAYGLRGLAFERSQQTFMFWLIVLFKIFMGTLCLGMGILAILKYFGVITALPDWLS